MGSQKDLAQRVQENSQALAEQQPQAMSPTDTIRTMIARNMNRIQQALPDAGVTPERLATIAFTAIRKTPALMECKPESLIDCIIKSAELGLNPGLLGHAHLVPYGSEATFIIGYQGMLELARRSGSISMIYAKAVYTEDQFSYNFGLNPDLVHVPYEGDQSKEWENVTHVYMVARFTNGGFHFGVMTKADVDKHRDTYAKGVENKSYGKYTSPWKTAPVPMALKTVIRQEWKFLPVATEIRQAVAEVEDREVAVIEGRPQTIWTSQTAAQMLEDGKPQALPAEPEVKPEGCAEPEAKPEAPKAATPSKKQGKAEPKPEPAEDEPTTQPAVCTECGQQVDLTGDVIPADLASIKCGGCGKTALKFQSKEAE